MGWADLQKAYEERKARKAAERAEKAKKTQEEKDLANKAQEYVEGKVEAVRQERVSISKSENFHFPTDLASLADSGYPFIRFTINQSKGTEKISIYLHQPPGITVSDGANYANFDMGILKGGFNMAMGLAKKGTEGVSEADVFATALIAKDKILSPGGQIENITSTSALKAGVATNPYTRTAYESTNIRGYNFSFKLVASNSEESSQAQAIERTFRKFLYPKRAGSIALVYPPLFTIEFYSGGIQNEYMPKIKPCYLTSLETTVNESTTAMHKDTGAPIEVNLGLTFQEERSLVRQDLYDTDSSIVEKDADYFYKGGDMGAMAGGKTGEAGD